MTTWVLLRGLAREQAHWGRFATLLQARVPAGDRVVGLDLPGNGTRHTEPSPTSVAAMVHAARAELRTRALSGDLMLVALSLGGMVAVQWALEAPQEVRGCILVNTSMGGISPWWQRLRPCALAALVTALLSRSPRTRERAVLRITSNLAEHGAVLDEWVAIAQERPVRAGNFLRQLWAAARFRVPVRPRVPVLVLVSHGDRLASPRCSAALALAWQAPILAHWDAGHDLALDAPHWLLERILDWVEVT